MKEKFGKEQKDNHNDIEDLMADMPDMEDDEKFRQWLEETYISEAEIMEKSLFDGQEYEKNLAKADEMNVPREKFYQRLKEEGLYEEESVENKNTETSKDADKDVEAEKDTAPEADNRKIISMEPGRSGNAGAASAAEKNHPIRKKRNYLRFGKIAGVAGVCLLCVFAASMTSEANRNYWIRGIKYLTGNDSRIVVGNDSENEDVDTDEYEAIEDIEKKLGVTVPQFYYRPQGMSFCGYEISTETSNAKMDYQYGDTVIMFYIDKQNDNTASNINTVSGEENTIDTISGEGIDIAIDEVQDDEEIPTYIAGWSKNDVSYSLVGKIKLEELEKIVKYMKF